MESNRPGSQPNGGRRQPRLPPRHAALRRRDVEGDALVLASDGDGEPVLVRPGDVVRLVEVCEPRSYSLHDGDRQLVRMPVCGVVDEDDR